MSSGTSSNNYNNNTQQSSTSASTAVRVAVRVRPCLKDTGNNTSVVDVTSDRALSILNAISPSTLTPNTPNDREFEFDAVYSESSKQEDIFEAEVMPLLNAYFKGFNATMLAYGQTGSGKSYSMGTDGSQEILSSTGMIPRALQTIFEHIRANNNLTTTTTSNTPPSDDVVRKTSVKITYLELYNEEWIDLFKTSNRPATSLKKSAGGSSSTNGRSTPVIGNDSLVDIAVREDKNGNLFVVGAEEIEVDSAEEAMRLFTMGSGIRTTAATAMNNKSSRSHAIFTVTLTSMTIDTKEKPSSANSRRESRRVEESAIKITSKFHFVDLAGSERLKRTQNTGDRKAEGIAINQGLLVLGRVIHALSEAGPTKEDKDRVIPYRDSKLTRFLQDSLGGNSRTMMLACISPEEADANETVNTLRYATRAQRIQNQSKINVEAPSSQDLHCLRLQIAQLQSMLTQATSRAEAAEAEVTRAREIAVAAEQYDSVSKSRKLLERHCETQTEVMQTESLSSEGLLSKSISSSLSSLSSSGSGTTKVDAEMQTERDFELSYDYKPEERLQRILEEDGGKAGKEAAELVGRYNTVLEKVRRIRKSVKENRLPDFLRDTGFKHVNIS